MVFVSQANQLSEIKTKHKNNTHNIMSTRFKVVGRQSTSHKKIEDICYGLSCRSAAEQSSRFWIKKGYIDCKVEAYETSSNDSGVPLSELF